MIKPVNDSRYKTTMCRIQIHWKDYKKLRRYFPPTGRNESAASYFERLAAFLKKELEELKNEHR